MTPISRQMLGMKMPVAHKHVMMVDGRVFKSLIHNKYLVQKTKKISWIRFSQVPFVTLSCALPTIGIIITTFMGWSSRMLID